MAETKEAARPEEIHLDVRPAEAAAGGRAVTVAFKKRRLGLDLAFDPKRGGAVLADAVPAKGLAKGMRLVAIDGEALRIDSDESFQALFFRLADGPRPVRIAFGDAAPPPSLPAAYVVPAVDLEAADVAAKDVLLALGGGDAFVLRGALSRERRRSVVAVRRAAGRCDRLGAPGDSVVAVGAAVVVPDAEARDVRGALRRALARSGPQRNVTLVPGSRGDVVYTVKLPAPRVADEADLADDDTLRRRSHGKSSRRSSVEDLLAEFARERDDAPATATEAWGLTLRRDGDVLRVDRLRARGLAAAAAVRPGDVVVALDDDVGPHRDLLAFASRCEAAANRARDRNTHVALTLASDALPRHLLRPPFQPALPPPPRRASSPRRRTVSSRADLRVDVDLSASESKRLGQLRRLLRAGVGALNHASEENSFKRPRPVIIREHGAFAGFVVEPARSRPVVVAFSRITSVEMPFAPRPRVEDAVLAASLSARFRTEAGEPRTLDLAFQSAAVAYMIADGLELARRQAARPPSPRASALEALHDPPARPPQRRLQRLSNYAAPLLMDGDAPQRTWWSTLRGGVVVELYYADDTYAVTTPLGDVPIHSTAFGEGQYCRCVVVRRMRAGRRRGKHWYVLRYKDGPYDCDQRRTGRRSELPRGTRFVGVPRDCCVLTYENQRLYWPIVLLLVTGAQVAAFVIFARREHGSLGAVNAGSPTVGPSVLYMRVTGPFPACFDARNQLWRLWTYQLVHVGWYHLGVNCAMQLFFGASVEMVHGHLTLLCVYMFGVAMGALTCAFADVHRAVVGASGGVYTLIGLHAADVLLNFRSMADRSRRLVRALICTAVPALDMLVYLLVYSDADTSYASHGGGLVAGFLLGLVVLRPVDESRCHYYVVRPLALLLLLAYVVFALFWHQTVYPPEYLYNGPFWRRESWGAPDDSPNCCWRLYGCSAIAAEDYRLFNCDDDRRLTISLAWDDAAFSEELTTCDALKSALDVALEIREEFDDV